MLVVFFGLLFLLRLNLIFKGECLKIVMQVDVVVTTAGGVEEDLIKCLAPTYKGDFSLPGAALRSKGLNRIGNLLVPNNNYCKFEDWIIPIFDKMLEEQTSKVSLYVPLCFVLLIWCCCSLILASELVWVHLSVTGI